MQIINMSKTKLNSLEPLILPKNVTSTECELFKYPYYGKEKLLKKLHRTDGIIFANKLYTIEALNANKDSMPSNFILPESLVSINKKIEAFTMKYIKGINLSVILNNPDITYEEKIHYLKSIGRILEQMQNIRKYTNLNNFYLEDIKVNIELIECFNKIVVGGNNINPCNYLDTLTPKQVAGAQLARAFGSYPKGRGFESPSRYQEIIKLKHYSLSFLNSFFILDSFLILLGNIY